MPDRTKRAAPPRRTIECICCGEEGPLAGRGLRRSCWQHWRARGQLDQFKKIEVTPKRIRDTIVCVCCGKLGRATGRGLRLACYTRLHRSGQLDQFSRSKLAYEDRAVQLYEQFGPDACWPWPEEQLSDSGYGPHRGIYVAVLGPVPEGLELDHLCRNRACVNPGHLEPVPRVVNLARGNTIVRANLAKTHCPQNHEYTPENTYLRKEGRHRDCLTCRKVRNDAWNQSRRLGIPYVDPFKTVQQVGSDDGGEDRKLA